MSAILPFALWLTRAAAFSMLPVSAVIPAVDPGCVTQAQTRQALDLLFPGNSSVMADENRSAEILKAAAREHLQIDADRVMISKIDDATTILTFFRAGCMIPELRKTQATENDR
jgi:hypothetical protein